MGRSVITAWGADRGIVTSERVGLTAGGMFFRNASLEPLPAKSSGELAEMVKAFIVSGEYRQRFGNP